MADMHRFLEVEMFGQRRQVVGIMIHVMAVARLGGAAMTATVVGDDAIAFANEEKHLRVPVIRGERPAMTEDDRLPGPPILIEDVDVSSVLFSDCDVWHWVPFLGGSKKIQQRLGCLFRSLF